MHHDPTPPDAIKVRRAERAEIGQLSQIWHDGWREAHARILPAELTRVRTRESVVNPLEVLNGTIPLEVWRYEKRLPRSARQDQVTGQPGRDVR